MVKDFRARPCTQNSQILIPVKGIIKEITNLKKTKNKFYEK